MGNLFPDSEEFPNHVPMPTLYPRVFEAIVPVVCVAGAIYSLCPEYHWHVDHSHQETPDAPIRMTTPPGAIGSTSANPFFSSTFDAADEIIRQRHALRDAQARLASLVSSTSSALLEP